MKFTDRLSHAWNAFMNKDPTIGSRIGTSYSYRPDRPRLTRGNEKTLVTAIFNRIALDVSSVKIEHVVLDDNDRFKEIKKSGLNYCLNTEANIDQTGRAFIQDLVLSMLDEGVVAVVPVDTSINPMATDSYQINTLRTAKILQWYPEHVQVRLYNDRTGQKEDITLPKKMVAIIENPLYPVVNEHNSTLQRLIRKLALLDDIDEQSGASKLDLIIQLPYLIRGEQRRQQAEQRRKDIEDQLAGSKYGIAYTDATEHVTQLNRSLDNNLMHQIEYLTSMLYSQLGITKEIMDGTANDVAMNNYYARTIEPIMSAIADEFKRKFLTKTARTQNQSIEFFVDPFKLTPINQIAEIADKFTRNEIMSSNEMRAVIGMKPVDNTAADELRNKNITPNSDAEYPTTVPTENSDNSEDDEITEEDVQNGVKEYEGLEEQIKELEKLKHSELMHYASKYYDPEKAHEYYMENRELKERASTSTLNENGLEVADYVKKNLDTQRDNKINKDAKRINSLKNQNSQTAANRKENLTKAASNKKEQKKNAMEAQIESDKNEMDSKISTLREKLENMTKREKAANVESIENEIAKLKNEVAEKKQSYKDEYSSDVNQISSNVSEKQTKISNKLSSDNQKLSDEHSENSDKITLEYDKKYADELDKIRSDPKYIKATTSSSSSSSSSDSEEEDTSDKYGLQAYLEGYQARKKAKENKK